MSLLVAMVARNIPLHLCGKMSKEELDKIRPSFYGYGGKELDKIASSIVAGLTHSDVVALVAREWEELPSVVRMRVTQVANDRYRNPSSHNQQKCITKLDTLLNGAVLSRVQAPTARDLRVIGGQIVSSHRALRPNVVGAARAFSMFVKPADFDSWPPAKKRKWHAQMAKERREGG